MSNEEERESEETKENTAEESEEAKQEAVQGTTANINTSLQNIKQGDAFHTTGLPTISLVQSSKGEEIVQRGNTTTNESLLGSTIEADITQAGSHITPPVQVNKKRRTMGRSIMGHSTGNESNTSSLESRLFPYKASLLGTLIVK